MEKLRAEWKDTCSVGDELTLSEKRELTNWEGYWNANAEIHLFSVYFGELKHERYFDIWHTMHLVRECPAQHWQTS